MIPINRALLRRYITGEATPDEREYVEAWLAEDSEHWNQLESLRGALADEALSEAAVQQAKAEVWSRLQQEIGGLENVAEPVPAAARASGPPARRFMNAQLAAGLILAIAGGTALGALLLRTTGGRQEGMQVARTAPGQRERLRLPDGSQVMLGVASSLRYPTAFATGSREVTLEGEAYFEVAHDSLHSFTVRAGDLIARDIGTAFAVRAYPEDSSARVVVRTGRVAVRAARGVSVETVVAPGQLARIDRGASTLVLPADTAVWFAWTEGRLVLEGTPLRDALPELGRWFNLEFRLADSTLGDVPLTVTLRTQPTEDVLNNLAASLGLRQRRVGRVVTLY